LRRARLAAHDAPALVMLRPPGAFPGRPPLPHPASAAAGVAFLPVLTSGVVVNREWISVAHAASMMGVCKRQALRLLARRDAELEGRLLRRLGDKHMPRGIQASKYLVSVTVLREAMRPDDAARDIERVRLEIAALWQQLGALRRALQRREHPKSPANAT
jgi:hypothetical protein